jgi:hypothetical protein
MSSSRCHATVAALAVLLAAGALGPGAIASTPSLAGGSSAPRVVRAKAHPRVRITTLTLTPKVQRTVRFNGYATYTFRAAEGRRIVSASARIAGAGAHAVKIQRRTVSRNRTRYTVNLVFPGEQGNPGKLIVRLGTIA